MLNTRNVVKKAASFNDSIDVPAARLYEAGITIPLNLDELKIVVETNVLYS